MVDYNFLKCNIEKDDPLCHLNIWVNYVHMNKYVNTACESI